MNTMKCSSGWRNDDFVGDREFGPALHKFLTVILLKPSAKRSKRLASALYCAKSLVKWIINEAKPDSPRARNRHDRLHRTSAKYGYRGRSWKTRNPNNLFSCCEDRW